MSKIIIQVQGGLVQEVFIQGNGNPSRAIIVDEDVECAGPEDITTIDISKDSDKRSYEACIHTEGINKLQDGCDVDCIVKAYLNRKETHNDKNSKGNL